MSKEAKKNPTADANLSKAISAWRDTKQPVEYNGKKYFYESHGARRSKSGSKIGFTDAEFNRQVERTNFWIKPDFVAVRHEANKETNGNDYHCIFIEHCCDWKNFYQKRFFYLGKDGGVELSFFEQDNVKGWQDIGKIFVDKILYMLPDDSHSERVIRVTPEFKHEIFSLNYNDWSTGEGEEVKAFDPDKLFKDGQPRKHFVDDFLNPL
jgi:hypothetical protein